MKESSTSKTKKTKKIEKSNKKVIKKLADAAFKEVEKAASKLEEKPIKKVTLGIVVPYYKNSEQCEISFKRLMDDLNQQLNDDMILCVYEDGQCSDWLKEYDKPNIKRISNKQNKGVSHARNVCIDYLIDKVNYILFIDSDDVVENNYLPKMWEYCADNTHEIIESSFLVNGQLSAYLPNVIRNGAAGSAIQTKIIGDIRFDEKLQIAEDTDFMYKVCDLTKYRKKHAPTQYIYQLGANENSLTMRFQRQEIRKER